MQNVSGQVNSAGADTGHYVYGGGFDPGRSGRSREKDRAEPRLEGERELKCV